ncbi:MAG TPA: hypothetical protein GXZ95_03250 [Mollicutes bacterium]|nr:hypothetical protein [Mollicutes bacterium]
MEGKKIKGHISFEEICRNKEYYVPIIKDNNKILEEIINYCVDKYLVDRSIETYQCCEGHDYFDTFVMFNVPRESDQYIYSILNCINQIYGSRYAIGQNRVEGKILLDVRLQYYSREYANEFLSAVKEGLVNYKKHKLSTTEEKNMVHIIRNLYLPNKELIFQKCHDNEYLLLQAPFDGKSLVNKLTEKIEIFTKKELSNLNVDDFKGNNGIQRTKKAYKI